MPTYNAILQILHFTRYNTSLNYVIVPRGVVDRPRQWHQRCHRAKVAEETRKACGNPVKNQLPLLRDCSRPTSHSE